MRKLIILFLFPVFILTAEETRQATFVPPSGWRAADLKELPASIKFMVVGTGTREVPPSINLGFETYQGTLKNYLKIVKDINSAQGDNWKDLGIVQTAGGPASLSQVDVKTEWGVIRQMHLIYLDQGVVYILTAAALREEFPKFYNDFFNSLKSFKVQVS